MPSIVITGGTRGIGKSILMKFAREGFDISTCARNENELDGLKKVLAMDYPSVKTFLKRCDVSIKADIKEFGMDLEKEMGVPDIIINNAGVFIPGKIQDEGDDAFETQINTNLSSAYHLTRQLLPGMIQRKSGYIFNICSTASIIAYTNGGSYCISKFALLGFSKVLREELKHHDIRVTSVLPGATNTSSWELSNLPSERFIDPNNIANLIFTFYTLPIDTVVEEIVVRPLLGDID